MDLEQELAAGLSAPASRSRPILAPLILAGGLVLTPALLLGASGLLLGVALAAGFGLTYLSGLALSLEERGFFGAVIGAMAVALLGFMVASIAGFSLVSVLGGAALATLLSAAGWYRGHAQLPADLADARARWFGSPRTAGHPWPLLAVAGICGLYTLRLMAQAYVVGPTGLRAGQLGIWGDWAAHLAYAGSFAYGQNFPPEFPIDPGHRLGYPFMIDFLAASLVPVGASLYSSLAVTSGFLALAFPGVFYLSGVRLVGSRAAAALAVFVFVLGGGLGFIYLFKEVSAGGSAILFHLPHEYTHMTAANYQWLNPVLANLLPQRSTLFGFSVALIAIAVLFSARAEAGFAPYLFAGVLVGVTPLFHVHAYGTVVALSVFWAALAPRRQWIAFFIPALVFGLPAVAWMFPPARDACAGAHAVCLFGLKVQVGWLATSDGHSDSVPWFWLKNLGLFIPALVAAQLWRGLIGTGFALYFAPMWLWFVIPNVVLLHPWDWDNNKFFIFWALLGSLPVGALLARLVMRGRAGIAAAAVLSLVLGLSGALDLARALDYRVSSIPFTDARGLDTAAWVRENTPARAIFLTSREHNEPVAALAGRRVVLGYTGWIWSYGIGDWEVKKEDVTLMLQGNPKTPGLLARYKVDYVVLGPQERAAPYSASEEYWHQTATLVYSNGEYDVYRIR
ncbi:MAG: hypothetical protein M3Z13_04760 [Candidatus Dormibacteraeota bacterium]|nr:hypothetical protein [Candidatus Dormibacteraeota bacterium]